MANGVGNFGRTAAGIGGLFGGLRDAMQLIATIQEAQRSLDLREKEQEQEQSRFERTSAFDEAQARRQQQNFEEQQRQLRALAAQGRSDQFASNFMSQQQEFGIAADPSAARQATTITPRGPLQAGFDPTVGIRSAVGRVAAGEQARQGAAQDFATASGAARTQAHRTRASVPFEGGVAHPTFPTEHISIQGGGAGAGAVKPEDMLDFTRQMTATYTNGKNDFVRDRERTLYSFGVSPGDPSYQTELSAAKRQFDQQWVQFISTVPLPSEIKLQLMSLTQETPQATQITPEQFMDLYINGTPGGQGTTQPGQGFRQFFPGGGRP